jgi:hypothetical protein
MKVLLEKMRNGYLRRWNLTINRKEEVMKNIKRLTVLSALIFSTVITASWFDSGEDKKQEIAKSVTIVREKWLSQKHGGEAMCSAHGFTPMFL